MRYDNESEDDYEEDDPNDPRHPDYDLSEAGIHAHHGYDEKPWLLRRGVLVLLSLLVLGGLLLPIFRLI